MVGQPSCVTNDNTEVQHGGGKLFIQTSFSCYFRHGRAPSRHGAPVHGVVPADLLPVRPRLHLGAEEQGHGEEGPGGVRGDPRRAGPAHDGGGAAAGEQGHPGADLPRRAAAARRGEADQPPEGAPDPHRRGHQFGRSHVRAEDQPPQSVLLPVRPRGPGRRPGGEARETSARPVPRLRRQIRAAGRSAQVPGFRRRSSRRQGRARRPNASGYDPGSEPGPRPDQRGLADPRQHGGVHARAVRTPGLRINHRAGTDLMQTGQMKGF